MEKKKIVGMKRFVIFLGLLLLWGGAAMGQSKGFMELYGKASEALKKGQEGIATIEISGKMLQELMPSKTKEGFHIVNRIEHIRQIKFARGADKGLFEELEGLAADKSVYEQMSLMNVDGQRVAVYKAPYGKLKSEYLILISKDGAALVCDILGNVSMKDVLGLLYGK